MKGKEKRTLDGTLREQAANEQDSAKLLKLITEINRLLDEKSQRIEHKDSAKAPTLVGSKNSRSSFLRAWDCSCEIARELLSLP